MATEVSVHGVTKTNDKYPELSAYEKNCIMCDSMWLALYNTERAKIFEKSLELHPFAQFNNMFVEEVKFYNRK